MTKTQSVPHPHQTSNLAVRIGSEGGNEHEPLRPQLEFRSMAATDRAVLLNRKGKEKVRTGTGRNPLSRRLARTQPASQEGEKSPDLRRWGQGQWPGLGGSCGRAGERASEDGEGHETAPCELSYCQVTRVNGWDGGERSGAKDVNEWR